MFTHNIDPTLFEFGPFEIRYYGLIFVLGFVIAYFMVLFLAKKKEIHLSKDDVQNFLMYVIIGVVIGSRLFYVFVYDPIYYLNNPLFIPAIWHGGLSFHGGLIGAAIAGLLFTKKRSIREKNISFYDFADITVIPLAFALFLGRIANFINAELVGRITDVSWCVNFPNNEGCRHPSQLYESAKNLLIFSVLWILKEKRLKKGFLFWSFIILYSTLRFFIGFFRAPDPQLGFIFAGLTMGQIINIVMFAVGVYFVYKLK